MIDLSARHLSLSFGGTEILKDVSFSLSAGDRAALVGKNGAGKSTLLKILAGELSPTGGEISRAGGKTVAMLDQHALESSRRTVLAEALEAHEKLRETEAELGRLSERVSAGDLAAASRLAVLSREFEEAGGLTYVSRTKSALAAVGLSDLADKSVATLSGGQKTTLALVKLLLSPPDILLLDEPTNHLDITALSWLEDTVAHLKCTVLCVSHDRWFLDRAFFRVLDLEGGKIETYETNYTAYREEKKKRRQDAQKHYDLQQKEIRRQEEIIRKYKQFNREKSIRLAESRQKALDRVVRLDKPTEEEAPPRFSFRSVPSPHDVLRIRNLSFSYGQAPIFTDFSAGIDRGERVFFSGPVGSGKSTLLKILAGRLSGAQGELRWGPGIRASYYDQENQDLNFSGTVLEELWASEDEKSQGALRSYLAAFGFPGEKGFQRVDSLSGGERCRLALAKAMRREANLLFLDEPTNHLDMDSKEALEEALLAYPGTLICVSHDRYFIRKLAGRVYFFSRGNAPQHLPRGIEGLEELFRASPAPESTAKAEPSRAKEEYLKKKKNTVESRRRAAAIRNTEALIRETEEEVEHADASIALYADDYQKLQTLYAEKEAAETRLEELYETLFALQSEEEDA